MRVLRGLTLNILHFSVFRLMFAIYSSHRLVNLMVACYIFCDVETEFLYSQCKIDFSLQNTMIPWSRVLSEKLTGP